MRAIIPSLQISTPSAVLRFDSVVGTKPATVLLLLLWEQHKLSEREKNYVPNIIMPLHFLSLLLQCPENVNSVI